MFIVDSYFEDNLKKKLISRCFLCFPIEEKYISEPINVSDTYSSLPMNFSFSIKAGRSQGTSATLH